MINILIQVFVNLVFGSVMSYLAIKHFLLKPDDFPVIYFAMFCFAQYIFISTLTNLQAVFNILIRPRENKSTVKDENEEV